MGTSLFTPVLIQAPVQVPGVILPVAPLPPETEEQDDARAKREQAVQDCLNKIDYNQLNKGKDGKGRPVINPATPRFTHINGTAAQNAASYVATAVNYTVGAGEAIQAWVGFLGSSSAQANQYMNNIIGQMNDKFQGGGWQEYQKTCLAQCIASEIIEYNKFVFTSKFGGTAMSVANGEGSCTEFSDIAVRLINGTGGSASVGHSPGHAFVQTTFEGNTWNFEPQDSPTKSNSCVFYR